MFLFSKLWSIIAQYLFNKGSVPTIAQARTYVYRRPGGTHGSTRIRRYRKYACQ